MSCDAIAFAMLTVDLDTINLWHIKITGNLLRIINSIASAHRAHIHEAHIFLCTTDKARKKNPERSWLCQSLFPLPIANRWSSTDLTHMQRTTHLMFECVCFRLFDSVEGSKLRGNVKQNLEFPSNGLMDSLSDVARARWIHEWHQKF